jgi:hypothetical protein
MPPSCPRRAAQITTHPRTRTSLAATNPRRGPATIRRQPTTLARQQTIRNVRLTSVPQIHSPNRSAVNRKRRSRRAQSRSLRNRSLSLGPSQISQNGRSHNRNAANLSHRNPDRNLNQGSPNNLNPIQLRNPGSRNNLSLGLNSNHVRNRSPARNRNPVNKSLGLRSSVRRNSRVRRTGLLKIILRRNTRRRTTIRTTRKCDAVGPAGFKSLVIPNPALAGEESDLSLAQARHLAAAKEQIPPDGRNDNASGC